MISLETSYVTVSFRCYFMAQSMVLLLRQNLSLTQNIYGLLSSRYFKIYWNLYQRCSLYFTMALKIVLQNRFSLKNIVRTRLRMFSSLAMKGFQKGSPQPKVVRWQQSITASLRITMNWFMLSTIVAIFWAVAKGSLWKMQTKSMNFFLIWKSMQSGFLKCFSRIMENFRKISRLFAICFEIYLSAPNTEERVSSTKDMMDFLSPLFDELKLFLCFLDEAILFLREVVLFLSLLKRGKEILLGLLGVFAMVVAANLCWGESWYLLAWAEERRTDCLMLDLNCYTSEGVIRISRQCSLLLLTLAMRALRSLIYLKNWPFSLILLRISSIMSLAHLNSSLICSQWVMKFFSQIIFPVQEALLLFLRVLVSKQQIYLVSMQSSQRQLSQGLFVNSWASSV